MLSYQHGYHAGCFADVVKHVTLSRLLHYMIQKDKPLFYLETHSGRGRYDLHDKKSLKTGEAQQGILPLWASRETLPAVFVPYVQAIHQLNPDGSLRYYPGSPELAIQMLRNQDRLFFCELHPGEFEHLDELPHQGMRVSYSNMDGLTCLTKMLPPIERRGLIFMDPSYEIKAEYRDVAQSLQAAYRRFATGVYCLWYPLLDKKLHEQLTRGLAAIDGANFLRVEFYLSNAGKAGMNGCGLWIINPPYLLAAELKNALQAMRGVFNPGGSSYLLESG